MVDRYRDFASLASEQREGVDYRVVAVPRQSGVAVIAPHGGFIEPGTSELASSVAGGEHSFYAFEGLIPKRKHGDLHITSSRFDEPMGRELVSAADVVLAMHGRAGDGDVETTWLGGLDGELVAALCHCLRNAGYAAVITEGDLAGRNQDNICNRGARRAGAQLELPRSLRDELRSDGARMAAYAAAVRLAIDQHLDTLKK